jgi:hypothetical protein
MSLNNIGQSNSENLNSWAAAAQEKLQGATAAQDANWIPGR